MTELVDAKNVCLCNCHDWETISNLRPGLVSSVDKFVGRCRRCHKTFYVELEFDADNRLIHSEVIE
jgi:hypothetical protein